MKKSFLAVFLFVTAMSGGAFAFDAFRPPHHGPHRPPPPPPPPHHPHHPIHGPGHGPIMPGPHHGR
ncbi:MAG: hypothetical protein JSU04_19235 [Bdellovibrionales bacterium]|nr:hypothetical protein [Bdellovibrionales bacterium]